MIRVLCRGKIYLFEIFGEFSFKHISSTLIDLFKKDVRIINAMINKKFFKRRYKRSPNRIAFYCFFEKSANKLLTHCHLIMRIPNYLKEKIEILMCIAEKCVLKFRYFIHFKKVPYSVSYMTKHYSDHNDNFEVF